jgi:hypothetical protein
MYLRAQSSQFLITFTNLQVTTSVIIGRKLIDKLIITYQLILNHGFCCSCISSMYLVYTGL